MLEEELSPEQRILIQREEDRYQLPFLCILKRLGFIPHLEDLVQRHYHATWMDVLPDHTDAFIFKGTYSFPNGDHTAIALMDPSDFLLRDHVAHLMQEKWSLPVQFYWTDPLEILRRIPHEDPLIDLLAKTFHASDLHVHRHPNRVDVRIRLDGLLSSYCSFGNQEWDRFHNRLKMMAHLDIAESRRPQSGHVEMVLCGHLVDMRISTHPTIHGENLVIRFLDKHKGLRSLETLGFFPEQITTLRQLTKLPYGLVILCGPTGAGKTTTLYSLLSEFDTHNSHITTLEDPVEYQLPGISQTEVRAGLLDYREGIRSLLRQDPDVMLIGEIRDEDTARMAFRAALTGHLVLTTLHIPHALAAPDRLINLGVPEFEIQHYLKAVVAQRLLRKICTLCQGIGCAHCLETGYKGRMVVAEIWQPEKPFIPMEDYVKELINKKITSETEVIRVFGAYTFS